MIAVPSDSAVLEVARQQRLWSLAANAAKRNITKWRTIALALVLAGAVIVTLAAQVVQISSGLGRFLAVIGGIAAGSIPVIRSARLSKERTRDWTRLRSVSEGIKSQLYRYLAGVSPYADADRDDRLRLAAAEIVDGAKDLEPRLVGMTPEDRPLPAVTDAQSYATDRVDQQISQYYDPKALEAKKKLEAAERVELGLGIAAVVLGVVAAQGGIAAAAAWVSVATTATGVLGAYVAAAHYADNLEAYSTTAWQLRRLRDEWASQRQKPGQVVSADEDFVRKCEEVISIENKGWMSKLKSD